MLVVLVMAGYSCPWCPVRVFSCSTDAEALRFFEHHLDFHFETGTAAGAA